MKLEVHDFKRPKMGAVAYGHHHHILSVACHPKLPIFATSSKDKSMKFWQFHYANIAGMAATACTVKLLTTAKVLLLSHFPFVSHEHCKFWEPERF
jgi:hypothetical protein